MARIRSIKPEFFTSEQIVECSMNARLLFIGLWCFSDDSGVHPHSAARMKMEIFPSDTITKQAIDGLVDELIAVGLLDAYKVADQAFVRVTGWKAHQRIDQPSYKYPLADGKTPANIRRTSTEHTGGRATNVHSGNGVERSIKSKGHGSRASNGAAP